MKQEEFISFKRSERKGGKEIEFNSPTENGEYSASLTIKTVELASKHKIQGKLVPTGDTYPGLRWVFKLHAIHNCWVHKDTSHSYKDTGGVIKLLRQCKNSLLSEIEFQAGYAKDESLVEALLAEVNRKSYKVKIELNGPYANFVSVAPLGDSEVLPTDIPEQEVPQVGPVKETAAFDIPETWDDDDIPF